MGSAIFNKISNVSRDNRFPVRECKKPYLPLSKAESTIEQDKIRMFSVIN